MYWFPEEDIGTFKMSIATNSQGLEAITGWRGAGCPGEDFVYLHLGQMEQCFDTSLLMPTQQASEGSYNIRNLFTSCL